MTTKIKDQTHSKKEKIYNGVKDQTGCLNPSSIPEIKVSMFKNYYAQEPLRTVDMWKWLKTKRFEEPVTIYRHTYNENKRSKIKANLPCITPSGVFSKRNSRGLLQHSGCICIDIDHKDNNVFGREWFEKKKLLAKTFDSLLYAGMSISGNGLYLIFRIAYPESHKAQFDALVFEIRQKTQLVADSSCSDVCRLRGASYDPYPYCNPYAKPYKGVLRAKIARKLVRTQHEQKLLDKKVNLLIYKIRSQKIDITDDYNDWYRIGCALANEYGKEEGSRLFHLVSMVSKKYYPTECDRQFAACMRNQKIGIGTFLRICKQHGVTFK